MRALAADGRRGAALAVYEQTRLRLADELGADPSPRLAALHVELLRANGTGTASPRAADPGRAGTGTAGQGRMDQGPAYRGRAARDVADQNLTGLGLGLAGRNLTDMGPRGNLPTALTSFIGRDGDLGDVKALLRSHRLVTLTGPGGAGKTRLAVEAARAAVADGQLAGGQLAGASFPGTAFPGGGWLAELAPVADPADVAGTVLSVFGVREQALLVGRQLHARPLTAARGSA
jgi:Bacterial transcriptional activator domain